jgi:hypothetical protein
MHEPRKETDILPPPPGIIGSLRAGFDTIAAHITVIVMPLALDLLLWLGPRLRVNQLLDRSYKDLTSGAPGLGISPDQIRQLRDSFTPENIKALQGVNEFAQSFNVFAILRTFPVGVSSIMTGARPVGSPLGTPMGIQVDSFIGLILWIGALTLVGWFFGGLYFRWVAALVMSDSSAPTTGQVVLQTLLYSFIWSVLTWTLGLPVILLISVFLALNPLIGEAILLFLGFLSMWLIVPVFFSAHGMFIRKQNALVSILSSFQMARFTMPTSSLFVMTVFLLGVGLNLLWAFPTTDSWLALVGILGHAFVTTALLASSFVYYHDMTVWLQTVLDRLRARMPTQQA